MGVILCMGLHSGVCMPLGVCLDIDIWVSMRFCMGVCIRICMGLSIAYQMRLLPGGIQLSVEFMCEGMQSFKFECSRLCKNQVINICAVDALLTVIAQHAQTLKRKCGR